MAFDREQFKRDGARYKKLRDEMKPLKTSLDTRLPDARAAGMTVSEIMGETGLADSWIRRLAPRSGDLVRLAESEPRDDTGKFVPKE